MDQSEVATHKTPLRLAGPGAFICLPLLLLTLAPVHVAPLAAQVKPRYGVIASQDVMIPMRDGVRLATDFYRPARNGAPVEGRFPAILMRTPYNKAERAANAGDYKYFVPRGYVVVMQDVRGRYKSEGHWRPLKDDPSDGFDVWNML